MTAPKAEPQAFHTPTPSENPRPQSLYTKRKMRIAELLAQGDSALEIADKLNAEGFRTHRGQKITVKRVQGDIMWLDAQWLLHAQRAIIGHKAAILQKVSWAQRYAAQSNDLKSFLAALKLEIDVTGSASPTIIGIEAVSEERVEEIRRSRWAGASAALRAAGIEPDEPVKQVDDQLNHID